MAAAEHAAPDEWAHLMSEDIRIMMPPNPLWFAGREPLVAYLAQMFDPARRRSTSAPGAICRPGPTVSRRRRPYVRRPGTTVFRAQVLDVLHIEGGRIVAVTAFEPHLFAAFGLPLTL